VPSWNYVITPLTKDKFYVTYGVSRSQLRGRLWNGTQFSDEEIATTSAVGQTWQHSTTNQGDNVHLVFCKVITHELIYVNRTFALGWGNEVEIQSETETGVSPVIAIDDSNNLYCFWSRKDNHVYYIRRVSGIWETKPTDWINETSEGLTAVSNNNCYYKSYEGKIGYVYMTKDSRPYDVKHRYIGEQASDGVPNVILFSVAAIVIVIFLILLNRKKMRRYPRL
jgi:hypothetical protein